MIIAIWHAGILLIFLNVAAQERSVDQNAPPLLARFYDLETGKPLFCDRDGVKKTSMAEIGDERRNGYSWYSNGFEWLQKKYEKWVG